MPQSSIMIIPELSNKRKGCHNVNNSGGNGEKKPKKDKVSIKSYLSEHANDPWQYNSEKAGDLYKVSVVPVLGSGIQSSTTECYFMAVTKNVNFRHMGQDKCPPVFYASDQTIDNDKVLIYFTGSGSGKTVELACSSYTRKADLAFLFSGVEDGHELRKAHETYIEECKKPKKHQNADNEEERSEALNQRQKEAGAILRAQVAEIQEYRELVGNILDSVSEKPRIVICFDEVSTCPVLVRSIIADRSFMAQEVSEELTDGNRGAIDVLFSFAGTGAARSSVGSHNANFDSVTPFAAIEDENIQKCMFDHSVKKGLALHFSDGRERLINHDNLKEHLPFVKALLQNGRMNSIARKVFEEADKGVSIDESKFLSKIINEYIRSNGLQALQNDEKKMLMGASALAVILFQPDGKEKPPHKLPSESWEMEAWHAQGKVVNLSFEDRANEWAEDQGMTLVMYLQSILGLIEPNDEMEWRCGQRIRKPFKMAKPQQLVVLRLLGIDLTRLLQLNSFGFEVLTTHLIKCVLAAACVVTGDKKPTVQQALSKIGFAPHIGMGWTLLTDKIVYDRWNELKNYRPIFHGIDGGDLRLYYGTHFMSTELDVISVTKNDEKEAKQELLKIDKDLHEALRKMKRSEEVSNDKVYAPFASINYGNSPLFDGSVTFFMRKDTSDENDIEEIRKYTIMNQSKDYEVTTNLKYNELTKHAARCNKEILDTYFGNERLLCLSARKDVVCKVTARETKFGRPFLPYCVNSSEVLQDLLTLLDERRSSKARTQNFAIYFDEQDEKVQIDDYY